MSELSIVMIVKNEAHRIARALSSVFWADEIVIIDAFSTDKTVEICRQYTDRIFQYPWEGYAKQRKRSIEHATFSWVFSLDADEVISFELMQEIRATIQNPGAKAGYYVPRKSWYLGRWIEHSGWYPDYQLRLLQKDRTCIESRAVHEGFSVHGETGRLNGALYHYSYDSISEHINKMNQYTTLEIPQKMIQTKGKTIRWYHLIFHPLSKFLRMYVVHKGYKDGLQGFILAFLSAFYTHLLYAKIWERMKST